MKKVIIVTISIILIAFLCSFSLGVIKNSDIQTLKSCSFQYNESTSDYSVFFALLNSDEEYIAADVDVNVRIVNDSNEVVYDSTGSVTEEDFDYYTSQVAGEQYLANIRIPKSKIAPGKSSSGKVYITISKNKTVLFDEVSCKALYCLPISDVKLNSGPFPVELTVKGFDGKTESKIRIDEVSYIYNKLFPSQLKITIFGEKTYASSNYVYDIISYKLYDSEGYMIDTGNIFLSPLKKGDKFKDDSIVIYEVVPGETYTLQLTESYI